MEPFYHYGQKLLFSRTAAWEVGDPVLLYMRPESLAPGQSQLMFKQLLTSPGPGFWSRDKNRFKRGNVRPMVIVRMVNPMRTFSFPADDILGIHKCLGPMEAWGLA